MRVEMQQRYVMKQITGDTLTPISVYTALNGKNKVLFESNAKFSESGRYSFIAVDPVGELKGSQYQCTF
ncbi:MAG: anthranilate synthase component I, partial [Solibacillus sp.]